MYSIKQYFKKMLGMRDIHVLNLAVLAWTNPAREELYHKSVDFMLNASPHEIERQSDPGFPIWPEGVVFLNGKDDQSKPEIEVVFEPGKITLEEIIVYLAKVGLETQEKKRGL